MALFPPSAPLGGLVTRVGILLTLFRASI
jgi:hypothetical protein